MADESVTQVTVLEPAPVTVSDPAPIPVSDFEGAKQVLLKTISDLVQKKPSSKEEVLEIFHSLQVAIGPWLVSGLPAAEQKAILVGLWAAEQLGASARKCLPFLK